MSKEIWDDDIGVYDGECESCGDRTKIKSCDDPFDSEINNEITDMGCVCSECFSARKEEI